MQLSRTLALLASAAVAVGAVSACGTDTPADGKVHVVAGFYPLEFLAKRIGGDQVSVATFTQPGAEPHDLELKPSQIGQVADAKLVLYLASVQPELDEAIEQNAKDASLDLASKVQLIDEADSQVKDPHIWLDPSRFATMAGAVADRLAQIDPAHAADYRARLATLQDDLAKLDAEYAAGLKSCQRRDIVTSHAAFGYLAERYRLNQIALSGLTPESEPTPQRIAEVAKAARESGATTIFFESLVSPKVSRTLADEVGASTAVLDPIEGLGADSQGDYLSLMRANLETLRTALGCS